MSSQCRCIARFGCQENLCFLDDRHAMHDRHKKLLQKEKFLHRSLSCQSVSEEHFEHKQIADCCNLLCNKFLYGGICLHPKVLTTLQKGLFDCEQTSCFKNFQFLIVLKNQVILDMLKVAFILALKCEVFCISNFDIT